MKVTESCCLQVKSNFCQCFDFGWFCKCLSLEGMYLQLRDCVGSIMKAEVRHLSSHYGYHAEQYDLQYDCMI